MPSFLEKSVSRISLCNHHLCPRATSHVPVFWYPSVAQRFRAELLQMNTMTWLSVLCTRLFPANCAYRNVDRCMASQRTSATFEVGPLMTQSMLHQQAAASFLKASRKLLPAAVNKMEGESAHIRMCPRASRIPLRSPWPR